MLWKNSRYLEASDTIIAIDPRTKKRKETLGIRLIDRSLPNHTIVKVEDGDDLFKIALTYYGDARLWHKIADVNPTIKDPMLLTIGSDIVIPQLEGR